MSTDWTMLLLALGIAVFFSFLPLREQTPGIVEEMTGALPDSGVVALWSTGVLFVILAPALLLLTNRPAKINLERQLLRVGWRTIPFGALRHAYRRVGGSVASQWILQLEIGWGLDARLPITTQAQPDLAADELDALLSMLEQAPIEPVGGEHVRAPLGDEVGARSEREQIADQISVAVMPFGRVSYAKPTLLAEVRQALDRARHYEDQHGTQMSGKWGTLRALSAVSKAFSGGGGGGPSVPLALDFATRNSPEIHRPFARGILGTSGRAFRRQRQAVEEWLRTESAPEIRRFMGSRLFGWSVFLLALPLPWIASSVVTVMTWPFLLWGGILLIYRARILRYVSDRAAALERRGQGHRVPPFVADFFCAQFPERSYAKHGFAYVVGLCVYLIGVLILVMAASFSMLAGWSYFEQEWERPFFIVVIALIVAVLAFTGVWARTMNGSLARAQAEWQFLATER